MRRLVAVVVGAMLLAPAALVGLLVAVWPSSSGAGLAEGSVPAAYQAAIARAGSLCAELTPARLAAQLYQESGFDPLAVSSAGAVGIAQFMPGTWTAHGIDADGDGAADPRDPDDAIYSAGAYDCGLARNVAGVPGDPVNSMLAAYNAGPYAVLKHGGIPPYAETRGYVERIRALEPRFASAVGVVPASAAASVAIAFAYRVLGTPYQWGGTGANGRFDCSGLTGAAYAAGGISLPRTSREQWYAGGPVPREQVRPGDLVFFAYDLTDPRTIHHVGIYVGNGHMIDAPYTGAVIRFDPIDSPDYMGAVRPS